MFRRKLTTLNEVRLSQVALNHNLQILARTSSGKQVIPILKSDAYGHGAEKIAELLDGKVQMVAVDGYHEALAILPKFRGRILVMGYIPRENDRWLKRKRVEYVAQTVRDLRAMAKTGKKFMVHMEINTGMNRMGIKPDEVDGYLDFLARHPKLKLNGIMTHFSSADDTDNSTTLRQIEEFDEVCTNTLARGFKPEFIHASATAGAVKDSSRYTNAIRVGIGLYGVNPLSQRDASYKRLLALKPVMTFKTKIIKTIDIEKGDKVGYNETWEAKRDSKIAVLPVGYYEGIPRGLSNKGYVLISGKKTPIVGRVCMNHVMVDITDLPDVREGSSVVIPVLEWAKEFNLLPNELLTRVNGTMRRVVE
jgi:alanine racemase